jgi:hypothetical protein
MMGWMAPLQHLSAKLLSDRISSEWEPSMGEVTTIGLDFSEACFSGARGRCRGSDGSAQAASACAGSGVLQSTAALSGWPGGGDSVACYSDAGCRFAASLGAEPVRNFSPSSAPFALARGKITGVITSSSGLITRIKKVGGSCRRI